MKTRNKVKLITTIICMVLSLIALYAFVLSLKWLRFGVSF